MAEGATQQPARRSGVSPADVGGGVRDAVGEAGKVFRLFLEVLRGIFQRPFQFREFISQSWFIASVTILPSALVAIPFGAVVAMQTGSLVQQLGAEAYTGATGVLAVVQQGAPLVTSLLIAGAAGSAVAADLGARSIREELDAMRVLGIDPVQRLVVPRVLGMMLVAVLLNGLVSIVGISGGYVFNIMLQGGTPGAYLMSFGALAQLPDFIMSSVKALVFGLIAGVVSSYCGMNPKGGPKGVGDAVNLGVVLTFLLLFFANLILTAMYLQIVPPKGS
ncbi:ABC transporter permease [Dietzia sp. UBA5065]|uniref:MlaE family ABC transporter permease n=1 Tax=Dietzia sp. UBA5065 TaxID=1946422 RepID=UPI0025C69AD4|nr:ABC transporter permease [Dietzia sp. UBA5065]HMT50379.1 ABC transporter permease [Dietzia sp.]